MLPLDYRKMARHWRSSSKARAAKLGCAIELPPINQVEDYLRNLPLRCSYCDRKLSQSKAGKPNMDHRIPLDRWPRSLMYDLETDISHPTISGAAGTENLLLACSSCNRAKGFMTEVEFRELRALVGRWADSGRDLMRRLKLGWFTHG